MQQYIHSILLDRFKDDPKATHHINRYIHYIECCEKMQWDSTLEFQYHHILPKSWGGDNSEANIIRLPLRHHFVAHYILSRTKDAKMLFAFHRMLTSKNGESSRIKESKIFQESSGKVGKMLREINRKEVVNLTTGEVFESLKAACDAYGILRSGTLSLSIRNHIKSKNCYWQYKSIVDKTSREEELERILALRRQTQQEIPIVNLTTGEVFESINAAKRAYGCKSKTGIHRSVYTAEKTCGCFWQRKDIVDKNGLEVELRKKEEAYKKFKHSGSRRKVRNLTTGEEFPSVSKALQSIGVNRKSSLKKAIENHIPVKGNYFEYID